MTLAEVVAALRAELDLLPEYPEPDTCAALREYDEAMNEQLESLRDVCRDIVDEHGTEDAQ